MPTSPALLLTMFAGALLYAAWGDIRTRTIPNTLNAAIALAAPLWWWTTGVDPWPNMAMHLAVGVALFAVFAGFFALGAMGGGDVKLVAAVGLWLPFGAIMPMLILMALIGGVLTLVVLFAHRMAKKPGQPEVPYGVAIAAATLCIIANDILSTLAH
ncbi:A24 family peptidase [Sphingomonas prati]|uniref:Prepilin peptidase CpaA n=1 Tax=Sphingomonas prati TaxID=1843237 RepID=A0A7W9F2X4_9SPHN|nr:prepilin peptidase [Sphingomonas prati]MBB5729274.1 prepilin peptidase CpaA [Sphingomonas prati]